MIAAPDETIELRRVNLGVAQRTDRVPPLIIGEDQENIGWLWSCLGRLEQGANSEQGTREKYCSQQRDSAGSNSPKCRTAKAPHAIIALRVVMNRHRVSAVPNASSPGYTSSCWSRGEVP